MPSFKILLEKSIRTEAVRMQLLLFFFAEKRSRYSVYTPDSSSTISVSATRMYWRTGSSNSA